MSKELSEEEMDKEIERMTLIEREQREILSKRKGNEPKRIINGEVLIETTNKALKEFWFEEENEWGRIR